MAKDDKNFKSVLEKYFGKFGVSQYNEITKVFIDMINSKNKNFVRIPLDESINPYRLRSILESISYLKYSRGFNDLEVDISSPKHLNDKTAVIDLKISPRKHDYLVSTLEAVVVASK